MRENIAMHFVQAKGILSQNNGMNIYRGCSHGCIYCDSRSRCYGFTHAFEDIEVKKNAPELLEQALRSKRHKCMIGTGAMCDPYLPAEKELQLTRKCLELIDRYEYGVTVLTKSNLVLRDLDLLQSINKKAKAVVQMTLTTYDEELCRKIEPHVSTTRERFEVLMRCKELGIPTLVWMTPILPFINDTRENIEGLLDYCLLAGFWCSMLVSRYGKATGNISIRRWIVISPASGKNISAPTEMPTIFPVLMQKSLWH
jgi:DNA repair photolyase